MTPSKATSLLQELQGYNEHQLRRLLVDHLTQQKLGLQWESNAIERDTALNANIVLPRLVPELAHRPPGVTAHTNLIIEGDNFDSLRLLKSTHAGKIRVIYIDPPLWNLQTTSAQTTHPTRPNSSACQGMLRIG